jgi:hypothetical protein
MIFMLAAMTLAQPADMGTGDRMRTSALTPAQITKPIMDLDCRLADRTGRWHRVRLHVDGGRGYAEPWAGGVLTTHTPWRARVTHDSSRLFGNLPFMEDKFDALYFGRDRGPFVQFRSFAGPPHFAVASLSQYRNRTRRDAGEATFVGHCDVRETAQAPLSEEESREFLSR